MMMVDSEMMISHRKSLQISKSLFFLSFLTKVASESLVKTQDVSHAQNRPEGKYRGFGENPGFGDFGDPRMPGFLMMVDSEMMFSHRKSLQISKSIFFPFFLAKATYESLVKLGWSRQAQNQQVEKDRGFGEKSENPRFGRYQRIVGDTVIFAT